MIVLILLIQGQALSRILSDVPEPSMDAWALESRESAELVSWSDMSTRLEEAYPEDRVVIFNDMVILDDRNTPAEASSDPVGVTYRALINAAASSALQQAVPGYEAVVSYGRLPEPFDLAGVLVPVIMLVVLGMMLRVMMMSSGNSGNKSGPFTLVKTASLTQTLDDVAGLDSARDEIREVVALMKKSDRIDSLGARPPKGILLAGPPGTGKTLLARAMAKDAGLSFMTIDAAGLHQMFVGMGPMRVRRAFAKARENAPCIIFIDELDAVGSRSSSKSGHGGVDMERANLINTFLTEMDGLAANSGIFVVGATNHPDSIDPALIRPGRIDRRITIGLPDRKGREEILRSHCEKLAVDGSVDLGALAGTTPGLSGADLAMLANEAAIAAAREDMQTIHPRHFAVARERLMLGQTGSVIVLSEEERRITAWHEAGHAIVAATLVGADPIEQVSILPRGGSLGHVMQVPDRDRYMETKRRMLDRMTILAGGRAAEVLTLGQDGATTGASADIQMLTRIAESMVTKWGMGEAGFLLIERHAGLGHSDATTAEIRGLADEALERATKILTDHRMAFDALAARLLAEDTVLGAEVMKIVSAHEDRGQPDAA